MRQSIIFLFFLCCSLTYSYGQLSSEKTGTTQSFLFNSKHLGEQRGIEVYLPPSYETEKEKSYPVMYVLDGQEYFLHPVAYQRMLRFKDKTPEFVVVGIASDRRKRRKLYYEDAQKFIGFLKEELIPQIDQKYRTLKAKERSFLGWEMAAGLGLEIYTDHPNTFNAFFLASPTHFTQKRIASLNQTAKNNQLPKAFIYVTKAPEEIYLERSLGKMDSILTKHSSTSLRWKMENLSGEDHYTTSLKTLNNGLHQHFNDYNTLRFYTLKEYDNFGDLESIKRYYKHRGERYGISPDVHRTTKHFLIYNALKEDNFQRFEMYAKEFPEYFQHPRLEIWAVRFGNYFAKYNKDKQAIETYKAGLRKFPKSPSIYKALGDFYKSRGKDQLASAHFKKATEYGQKK